MKGWIGHGQAQGHASTLTILFGYGETKASLFMEQPNIPVETIDDLPIRQEFFMVVCGLILLAIVIWFIRNRKILEQYSIVWIATALFAICFPWLYSWVEWFTVFIGAGSPTSTVLFFAVLFLLLMNLQMTVKITDLSHKEKDTIQEIALLSYEVDRLRAEMNESDSKPKSSDPSPE